MLISAGRYDEAADHCQKLPADYRERSGCLGRVRLGQGRAGEAIQLLASVGNRGYLGHAYARAGRRKKAEELAAAISPSPFNQALILAGLGDKDRTLEAVESMATLGPLRIGRALTYPESSRRLVEPVSKMRAMTHLIRSAATSGAAAPDFSGLYGTAEAAP